MSPHNQSEGKVLEVYSQQYLQFSQFSQNAESSDKSTIQAPAPSNNSADMNKCEHVCEVCSQSFTYKHNLKAHYRLHTGEKPYMCRICKKEYTFYPSLKNHLLSVHFSELSKSDIGNQKQQLKMLLSKKR